MSARSSETAVLPQEPTRTRATVVGGLPGTSAVEAFTVMRGELGAPHRSGLLPLPQRSDVADDLPRTVAVLTELWCDLQPHGWRLQRHDSKESRAARSLLASDLNVLADVIGAESGGDLEPVTTQLLGPTALAARLHLHGGERVLRDHGARRDLVDSLADGLGEHLSALRQSIGPRGIVICFGIPRCNAAPGVQNSEGSAEPHLQRRQPEDLAAAGEGLGQTLHLENILLRHEVRCRPSGSSDGRMARM